MEQRGDKRYPLLEMFTQESGLGDLLGQTGTKCRLKPNDKNFTHTLPNRVLP